MRAFQWGALGGWGATAVSFCARARNHSHTHAAPPTLYTLRSVQHQVPLLDGLLTVELMASPPASYQKIAVLVDGAGSFLRPWARGAAPPTAGAVLRGRILVEHLGHVVLVPQGEWEGLQAGQRLEYLVRKFEDL
jgi:hypothetical protein